jgi:cell division septal protein FtsQ
MKKEQSEQLARLAAHLRVAWMICLAVLVLGNWWETKQLMREVRQLRIRVNECRHSEDVRNVGIYR